MPPGLLARMRRWEGLVRRDVVALYLAGRDPRVPWYAKAAAAVVAAYALSPIDLIPDFVPILGYLDDVVIVPLGIMLAVKLIPSELMTEFRAEAARRQGKPATRRAAAIVIAIWTGAAALLLWLFWPKEGV
jgi:uncharacterized membrane protein YkvA (DUF1232 family)